MSPTAQPPQTRPELAFTRCHNETVVYDEQFHAVHLLNPAVGAVWEQCDGETSIEQMAVRLAANFGVPVATIEADLPSALNQLAEAGLLTGHEHRYHPRLCSFDQPSPGDAHVLGVPPDP